MPVREWLRQFVAMESARTEASSPEVESDELPAQSDAMSAAGESVADVPDETDAQADDDGSPDPPSVAMTAPPEAEAADGADETTIAEPAENLDADDGAVTAAEAVAAEASVETPVDAAPSLDDIEGALRQVCEDIRAAEPRHGAGAPPAASLAEAQSDRPLAPEQGSAVAISRLVADVALLLEVIDCGFERIEAVSALQMADLRGEMGRLLDEVASRIRDLEGRPAEPVEVAGRAPRAAAPSEHPDTDAALRGLFRVAPPTPVSDLSAPPASPSSLLSEPAAIRGEDSDFDAPHGDPAELASAEPDPDDWRDPLYEVTDVERRPDESEEWSHEARALAAFAAGADGQAHSSDRGKKSGFPWLDFLQRGPPRKAA
ncbi:MAG TPA: hypothetical protein VMT68_11635 [Caulobacteraceae bacterium]|nr:hypothetical protein [Caulobacteraceae bacterium]